MNLCDTGKNKTENMKRCEKTLLWFYALVKWRHTWCHLQMTHAYFLYSSSQCSRWECNASCKTTRVLTKCWCKKKKEKKKKRKIHQTFDTGDTGLNGAILCQWYSVTSLPRPPQKSNKSRLQRGMVIGHGKSFIWEDEQTFFFYIYIWRTLSLNG